jgi:hypothetical protein
LLYMMFLSYFVLFNVGTLWLTAATAQQWQIQSFDITLDDFNPADEPNPHSGEIQINLLDKSAQQQYQCQLRWLPKNVSSSNSPHQWTQCRLTGGIGGLGVLNFRTRNITSSFTMQLDLDLIYLDQRKREFVEHQSCDATCIL